MSGVQFRSNKSGVNGEVRVEQLQGRKYLVAPVVLVREQVLNGDFLPSDEIESSVPGWNGVPVTVNHPTDGDGEFVSANSPGAVESYGIGQIFGAEYAEPDDGTPLLRGEAWTDTERMVELGDGAEQVAEHLAGHALAAQDESDVEEPDGVLEVSTGYFHDRDESMGQVAGEEYESVHVNLLADHLAILPNATGACSVEDGCGTPRTNENRLITALRTSIGL